MKQLVKVDNFWINPEYVSSVFRRENWTVIRSMSKEFLTKISADKVAATINAARKERTK